MQDRVRLDFRWFRGLQRQVQGRRLLQGPPRPHHQTVDSPLPPPAPRPEALLSRFPQRSLRTSNDPPLPRFPGEAPPSHGAPSFTTHSCETKSSWNDCKDIHGGVKDVVSVRAAQPHSRIPAATPQHLRTSCNPPATTPPQLQPPRHTPKPTARHHTAQPHLPAHEHAAKLSRRRQTKLHAPPPPAKQGILIVFFGITAAFMFAAGT